MCNCICSYGCSWCHLKQEKIFFWESCFIWWTLGVAFVWFAINIALTLLKIWLMWFFCYTDAWVMPGCRILRKCAVQCVCWMLQWWCNGVGNLTSNFYHFFHFCGADYYYCIIVVMILFILLYHCIRKIMRILHSKHDFTFCHSIGTILEHILKEKVIKNSVQ